MFGFVNEVPTDNLWFHGGSFDHTSNDRTGYMLLLVVNTGNLPIFSYQINNLCIGTQYEFSVYLANVMTKARVSGVPVYVYFEVREATSTGPLLARNTTKGIDTDYTMTWSKHSLFFTAMNSSVVLLLISHVGMFRGYGLAIDDIELRHYSSKYSFSSFSG